MDTYRNISLEEETGHRIRAVDDNGNTFEVVTDGSTPINTLPRHIVDDEVGFFMYDENRSYRKGSIVIDLESRWLYYCAQDCPAGTILDDIDFFIPIPDDVAKEKVLTHAEDLTLQIDGTTTEFTTVSEILDRYFTLYVNGIRQELDINYEIIDGNTFKMLYSEPLTEGDRLLLEFYVTAEKVMEYPDEIRPVSEDLSVQIDETAGNMNFDYTINITDNFNVFWNGIRLRQFHDYIVNRGLKRIEMSDVELTVGDKLILETYIQPEQAERRLVKQDIDLTPQIDEVNTVFELGKQRVGDTYNLWLNGVKLKKDLDFYYEYGPNTVQTLNWIPQENDTLVLEVYKMI